MTIKKTVEGSKVTLALSGWLDTQAAPELAEELDDLPGDAAELVFDMADCEYISSSGVRQIVAAHKKLDGHFALRSVSEEVLDVLNMTGIAKRITIA